MESHVCSSRVRRCDSIDLHCAEITVGSTAVTMNGTKSAHRPQQKKSQPTASKTAKSEQMGRGEEEKDEVNKTSIYHIWFKGRRTILCQVGHRDECVARSTAYKPKKLKNIPWQVNALYHVVSSHIITLYHVTSHHNVPQRIYGPLAGQVGGDITSHRIESQAIV